MNAFSVIVLATGLFGLIFVAFRSRELFVLAVDEGRTRIVRGRAPPALVDELADVFARARVRTAKVKVLRAGDHARLMATGLDEFALQRARNVLGMYPAHKLLGGKR